MLPVHCQSVSPVKVPLTTGPPGPNCTLIRLPARRQFDGTIHEMLPRSWNVRSTVGTLPPGKVMAMKSCGGGMRQSCQRVSAAKSVDTAWSSVLKAR